MVWKPFCQFFVHGEPKAQPRARAFVWRGRARMYDAGTADGWKTAIGVAAMRHRPKAPLAGPVRVSATYYFPRPVRLSRRKDPPGEIPHTVKPDRDNLDKATLDALTAIDFWRDDCQVCSGQVDKLYVAKAGRPGALITIEIPDAAD